MIRYRPFRQKRNFAIALLTELLAPLLRRWAERRTGSPVSAPQLWRRALILGDNHIGDLLYRTCSLRALKTGLPECDFYYLAAPGTADILAGNPYLKAVLPWARSDSRLDLSPEHMRELRSLRFDTALCTNCIRYWPELLLAIRLGIPNRAGYTYKGFSGWVTHAIPIRYPQPFAAYFRDYVAALAGQGVTEPLRPELHVTPAAEEEAENAFRRLEPANSKPVVAFFLTSRQPAELWPAENYATLFKQLGAHLSVRIVLLGSPDDRVFLEGIASRTEPDMHVPVCTALSLPGLAAFLKRCSLVVAKDSGPRHMANAVGTPLLFFRNTTFSQVEAGIYCPNEFDLTPPGEFLDERRQRNLLASIEPAEVLRQVERAFGSKQR